MKTRVLDVAILAFLVAQMLDGVFTYFGIVTHGAVAEGNPIVAGWVHLIGPAGGVSAMKLLAVGCGLVLYFNKCTGAIVGLTVFYLAAAVFPWGMILFSPAI